MAAPFQLRLDLDEFNQQFSTSRKRQNQNGPAPPDPARPAENDSKRNSFGAKNGALVL